MFQTDKSPHEEENFTGYATDESHGQSSIRCIDVGIPYDNDGSDPDNDGRQNVKAHAYPTIYYNGSRDESVACFGTYIPKASNKVLEDKSV